MPVFIENMQLISTKTGRFHPVRGLRKVEIHYGEPIALEKYLEMPREEFVEFVRQKIVGTINSKADFSNTERQLSS